MERVQRLDELERILREASGPVCGTELAERLGVSRQAVVQDVAHLRNRGIPVVATAHGYVLQPSGGVARRLVAVRHEQEDIFDELVTVVEAGGRVVDVVVDHPVYGELRGTVGCSTRAEVVRFVHLLTSTGQRPLSSLADGFHLHTLEAPDEATLDRVEQALREKGFLSPAVAGEGGRRSGS